jgi:uncharacterized protein (TIGR02996 family)
MDEEGHLAAIAATPADLELHVAYADWLAGVDAYRAELLRAWVEVVRSPVEPGSMARLAELKARYRELLIRIAEADGIPWLRRLNQAREWASADVAVKFVRVVLARNYDENLAASWPLRPQHAMLDDRWTVEPVEPLPPERGSSVTSLRFFVAPGTGDVSDVSA